MPKRFMLIMLCLVLLPLIAGCLDIEERVSIAPDGTSRMKFKFRMALPEQTKKKKPEQEVKTKLQEVGSGVEGLEVENLGIKDEFGQMIVYLNLKANSFEALRSAYDTFPKNDKKRDRNNPEPGDQIEDVFSKKGFYTIKKKGRNLIIERKLGTKKKRKKKKAKGKEEDLGTMMAMLGGITLRFDLEVPSRVISSNAEEVNGNVLHWVIPMQYLDTHKVTLRAEIESTPELTKALLRK